MDPEVIPVQKRYSSTPGSGYTPGYPGPGYPERISEWIHPGGILEDAQPISAGWSQPPYRGISFQSLVFATLIFQLLPRSHDHSWSLRHRLVNRKFWFLAQLSHHRDSSIPALLPVPHQLTLESFIPAWTAWKSKVNVNVHHGTVIVIIDTILLKVSAITWRGISECE